MDPALAQKLLANDGCLEWGASTGRLPTYMQAALMDSVIYIREDKKVRQTLTGQGSTKRRGEIGMCMIKIYCIYVLNSQKEDALIMYVCMHICMHACMQVGSTAISKTLHVRQPCFVLERQIHSNKMEIASIKSEALKKPLPVILLVCISSLGFHC